MTVENVITTLSYIRELAAQCDHEAAHVEEDKLHRRVLEAIRDRRCQDAHKVVTAALGSLAIEFRRECA